MESRSELRAELDRAKAENAKLKRELAQVKGKAEKDSRKVGPTTETRPSSHTDMQVRG